MIEGCLEPKMAGAGKTELLIFFRLNGFTPGSTLRGEL